MKYAKQLLAVLSIVLIATSCDKDDEPTLGNPPSDADAQFTYQASATSDNIIEFTANNSNIQAQWNLGNGSTAEGTTATGIYPQAGTYTVTLTVFNSGGSNSSTQEIVIANDDPSLLDNILFDYLTGGQAGPGFKTWAVDSASDGHFGVGPNPPGEAGEIPEWYAANANEKTGAGMYDDRYTFTLQGFMFDMETNGEIYLNGAHTGDWPEAYESPVGDYTSPFPDQLGEAWTIVEGEDTTLTVSGDAFIGYYTGVQTYKILNIEENQLFIRMEDAADPALTWYLRLVPEGFDSGGGEEPTLYSLPLDFENEAEDPEFTVFGNSTYEIVANPDPSGINTSSRVLQTTHGNEPWAGMFVNLDGPLDFSSDNTITLKVWAPITGTFRMKLEERANSQSFVEVDMEVTEANTWQEISWDFSGSDPVFDRLVIFPGWDVPDAGTFYIDDITQP